MSLHSLLVRSSHRVHLAYDKILLLLHTKARLLTASSARQSASTGQTARPPACFILPCCIIPHAVINKNPPDLLSLCVLCAFLCVTSSVDTQRPTTAAARHPHPAPEASTRSHNQRRCRRSTATASNRGQHISARLLLVMAEPTQLAFRTLKGIGILNTNPVYEPLPGFVRYVHIGAWRSWRCANAGVGLKEISDVAATRRTAGTLPGRRLRSEWCT